MNNIGFNEKGITLGQLNQDARNTLKTTVRIGKPNIIKW